MVHLTITLWFGWSNLSPWDQACVSSRNLPLITSFALLQDFFPPHAWQPSTTCKKALSAHGVPLMHGLSPCRAQRQQISPAERHSDCGPSSLNAPSSLLLQLWSSWGAGQCIQAMIFTKPLPSCNLPWWQMTDREFDAFWWSHNMGGSINGVPKNGWFTMENPIKMDDLAIPPCMETSIWFYLSALTRLDSHEMLRDSIAMFEDGQYRDVGAIAPNPKHYNIFILVKACKNFFEFMKWPWKSHEHRCANSQLFLWYSWLPYGSNYQHWLDFDQLPPIWSTTCDMGPQMLTELMQRKS